ncbi:TetR/AcrR family transcriptional regulator [Limosilactobacillus sp.]|uniref:TetR/AcrR family transcriptional regulator n=1 Tax=Limosilactobacillus sp. TaxID=2773925 RepID=UPI0035A0942E
MTSLNQKLIIQTGISIIQQQEKMSFSTISHKLGIHSQALYFYFKNQSELNQAIVVTIVQQIIDACKEQVFGKQGRKAITTFILTIRQQALDNPDLARFTLNLIRNDPKLLSQASFEHLRKLFNILIKSTYQEGKQRLLASRIFRDLLVGDIYNNINGWFNNPQLNSNESFSRMMEGTFEWLDNMKK